MKYNVASTQNEYIRLVRSLRNRKAREETGLFVVEGEKMVSEALDFARDSVVSVLASDKYNKKIDFKGDIYFAPEFIIKSVSDQQTPEGILAVIERERLYYKSKESRNAVLDGITDPGNLGTILRTCLAFGFDKVYLYNCTDCFSYKALRASMGSIFKLEIAKIDDLAELYNSFEKHEIDLIAADLNGQNITDVALNNINIAAAIGSESHGVSQTTLEHAKVKVKIPMQENCESLNAAVAAGIILYQITINIRDISGALPN